MTIEEFINALDGDPVHAEVDEQGNVYIYDNTYDVMLARLESENSVWEVEDDSFIMSPSLLRLMAELADTPPAKRAEPRKYVILNSELRHNQHWDYFKIGDKSQYLILRSTRDTEVLKMGSYTLEELEKEKRWLPGKWRSVINSMLTPLDVALEEGKGVPKTDRTIEVKNGQEHFESKAERGLDAGPEERQGVRFDAGSEE